MLLLTLLTACSQPTEAPVAPGEAPAAEAPAEAPSSPLVIYSGRGESLVGALYEEAEAALGIDLEIRYGDTPELVTLVLTEGAESPADLIFAQDSGHLGALAGREMLAELDQEVLALADPRFRDEGGRWVGTSGRARVLVYNTGLDAAELPQSLEDLADPKWKGRLGWAPTNGSFQAHVSALRHAWGEERTRAWLAGVKANEPTVYPKNSPQVEAAASGEIDLGWVNHYYLHKLKKDGYAAANYSFPAEGDAGNVLMLAGMAVRAGSPRAEDAQRVIAWMLSEPAQQHFASVNYEYPTRPGVATHPDVPPVDSLKLAEVEQSWLADMGPTRVMLQELGLL